ncbi:MAG: DNA polymerase III subunit gamma/tau, partial [Patescibacteria group bacterium]
LKNAAKMNRFGHAYLFYGPRGTGKTTTARLIAKLLNCEKRRDDKKFHEFGEPCNACAHCTGIDLQNSFDVVEIDAASNRGIDEIRNLKEGIRTSPASGEYKVYIIDEAHMLTTPAWNALLKTLEEPPAHAVLILATTEYEKIPATIISRTQRFLFKKLPKIKIIEKLTSIIKKEKIKADDAALELIATAAEGSLRDAESLLDQIASLEEKIDVATVERITGRVGTRKVEELAELIVAKKLSESLRYIAELNDEGHNLNQLTRDMIHYLRKAVSLWYSPELEKTFHGELTADELKKLKKLAALQNPEKTIVLIQSLIHAYSEMRYSPFAMVPLEIALIENLTEKI